MSNVVRLITVPRRVQPTIAGGVDYSQGDRIGQVSLLDNLPSCNNEHLTLLNVQAADRSGQCPPLDIWFFNKEPTSLTNENDPFDFDASDLDNVAGCATILECDWCKTTNRSFANTVTQVPMKPMLPQNRLWIAWQFQGETDTGFANGDLRFLFYFAPDYS